VAVRLSLRLGPYEGYKASFRARNLALIATLTPLLLVWLWLYPGFWLPLTLGLSGAAFWLGQKLNPRRKEASPSFRDLDPWASAVVGLAICGPVGPLEAIILGLGGLGPAFCPRLGRRPGLMALLVLALGQTNAPNLATFWALCPGAIYFLFYQPNWRPWALFFFWLGLIAPLTLLPNSQLESLGGPEILRRLPFILVISLTAAFDALTLKKGLFAVLVGLAAIFGGTEGLMVGLGLWALTLLNRQDLGEFWPKKSPPELEIPTGPKVQADLVATRLCRRERSFLKPLLNQDDPTPPPLACRQAVLALDCPKACLGLGDCLWACPYGAIEMGPQKAPIIKADLCQGCGQCLAACPLDLLVLSPRDSRVYIPCRTLAKPKALADLCPVGCLGCGRCLRACPAKALSRPVGRSDWGPPLINNLRCQWAPDCGLACQAACPRSIPSPLAKNPKS
jgi:ferredoxin